MRSAKAEFIKKQLNYTRSNPKQFWNKIHSEILPEDKDKIFNFKNEESGNLYRQVELPEVINNFFAEIGPKLASKITKSKDGFTISGDPNPVTFELRQFYLDELINLFKNISI